MRISGGSAKGRRTATKKLFAASRGERLRPTSAKVREALFDILMGRIEGVRFVDLYAGTGTVGFESLSRGAAKAVFVEPDPVMTETMRQNAHEFGFSDRVSIIQGRADEFLKKVVSSHERYDIFFLDPPYESDEIEKVLPVIGKEDLLDTDGVVIVEHYFKKPLPQRLESLQLQKQYRYGDTMLTFFRKVQ
jgi:16S rRNA (guanine(966)-N(2))-methyltransferase RsmD